MERNKSSEQVSIERYLHAKLKKILDKRGVDPVDILALRKQEASDLSEVQDHMGKFILAFALGPHSRQFVDIEQLKDEWKKALFNSQLGTEAEDVISVTFCGPQGFPPEVYLVSDTSVAKQNSDGSNNFYPMDDYEVEMLIPDLEGFWINE